MFSGVNGYRETHIFLVQLTTSRIGARILVGAQSALCDDDTHILNRKETMLYGV